MVVRIAPGSKIAVGQPHLDTGGTLEHWKVWNANSVLTSPATVEPINRSKPWSGTLLSVELARFALGLISPHRKHVIYDLGILDTYHLTYGLDVVEPFVFL